MIIINNNNNTTINSSNNDNNIINKLHDITDLLFLVTAANSMFSINTTLYACIVVIMRVFTTLVLH